MTPTITQADRDAAAKWAHAEDSEPAMQEAFAAHREAEAARIVAWLRGHHWTPRYMPTMEMVAEYIERGEYNAKGE